MFERNNQCQVFEGQDSRSDSCNKTRMSESMIQVRNMDTQVFENTKDLMLLL